jgi:acid phosphatase family membrane protein YuiD
MYNVPFLISIFRAIIILIRSYTCRYEKCKIAMHLNETQKQNKQGNYEEEKRLKKNLKLKNKYNP